MGPAALLAGGIDTALAISQLSGLLAALAALGGLVLTARPAWLERSVGLDRMIGWHRITGMTAAFGMAVHVAASLYAAGGGLTRMWTGLIDLITGPLTGSWPRWSRRSSSRVVSLTSWRRLRTRMTYETWHMVHLAGYLAVALAFPHALFSGTTLGSSAVAPLVVDRAVRGDGGDHPGQPGRRDRATGAAAPHDHHPDHPGGPGGCARW